MLCAHDLADLDANELELHGEGLGETLRATAADPRAAPVAGTDLDQPHRLQPSQPVAEHAVRRAARRLLIDLRGLVGRVGSLSALLVAPATQVRCKVAVVDVPENDSHYAFPETAARALGGDLRYFASRDDALDWL